jgi:hypothetical protein
MLFKKFLSILFTVFSILTLLSCDKSVDEEVMYSPDLKMPVVTGLYISGEASPEVLGVWRNPSGHSFCNPSIGHVIYFKFSIPSELRVKVWLVPARLPEQNSEDILKQFNAYYAKASGVAVAVLMNETKSAGNYQIECNFRDSNGNQLPEGFYRIYIQAGEFFEWGDVLNFRNESNYYKVLVNQINNQIIYLWSPR